MFSAVKKPRKLKRTLRRKVTRDWLTSENTCITRKEMFQIAAYEVLNILLNSEDAGLTEKYVVSTLFWKVSVLCKWIFACKCKSATADRIRWLQLQGASPLKWSYHQRRSSCNIIHHHRHHRVLTKTQVLRKACDNFRTSTIDDQERTFYPKTREVPANIFPLTFPVILSRALR